MSKSKLFNDPLDTRPDTKRSEPDIWIKRLVIIESLDQTSQPIRDIEFRLGLNIICTDLPKKNETRPIGHNVGKTLLTRLIRYCLGEEQFATEPTRAAISAIYPHAYVFAEVRLKGHDWVVARPIGSDRRSEAWCLESSNWQALLDDSSDYYPFSVYANALDEELASQHAELPLTISQRHVQWLNILAWLARDQHCRYRNPVEWRAAVTGSGNPELVATDASLLIRMVMDVLGRTEQQLNLKHSELLKKLASELAKQKTLENSVQRDEQFLKDRLRLPDEALMEGLFADAARKAAKQQITEKQTHLKDLQSDQELTKLRQQERVANEEYVRIDQELVMRRQQLVLKEDHLSENENELAKSVTKNLKNYLIPCSLPEGQCPNKTSDPNSRDLTPQRKHASETLKEEIAAIKIEIRRGETKLDHAHAKLESSKAAMSRYEKRHSAKLHAAFREIASLQLISDEVRDYLERTASLEKQKRRVISAQKKVDESRTEQRIVRGKIARNKATLNSHFNRVLSAIVGGETAGRIDFDLNGLHLRLHDQSAQQGEGLATAESVHSFDLACLSASICGLGTHPRLLIHDSPREGDLELHIYHNMFRYVQSLESSFGNRLPSFQYIVTTTTPVQRELQNKEFVRAKLNRIEPSGLLLKKQL